MRRWRARLTASGVWALAVGLASARPARSRQGSALSARANTPINAQAVWNGGARFRARVDTKCGRLGGAAFAECFLAEMQAAGAPAEALRFARAMREWRGDLAYMVGYRAAGRVGIAYVFYPYRANENMGVLLVNGRPSIVDIDGFRELDQRGLERDRTYQALLRQYPHADLWPGNRYSRKEPRVERGSGGRGERFLVTYWVQDGCHACARLGTAQFAFEFNTAGRLLGTKFVRFSRIASGGDR